MNAIKTGYSEYQPAPLLQPFIECYWSYFREISFKQFHSKPIIPDGCIDIIFDMGDLKNGRSNSFVVGAMTKPITNDRTDLIGVRFKPGMAYRFLMHSMVELTDKFVDFHEFKNAEADYFLELLRNSLTLEGKIAILDNMFLKKTPFLKSIEEPVKCALMLISQTNGKCTINEISSKIGWSRQHLTRKFLYYTGLTPKFLSQIVRIKELIKWHKIRSSHNWSDLSLEAGFYDQSHMINVFRNITGVTPNEFLQ